MGAISINWYSTIPKSCWRDINPFLRHSRCILLPQPTEPFIFEVKGCGFLHFVKRLCLWNFKTILRILCSEVVSVASLSRSNKTIYKDFPQSHATRCKFTSIINNTNAKNLTRNTVDFALPKDLRVNIKKREDRQIPKGLEKRQGELASRGKWRTCRPQQC